MNKTKAENIIKEILKEKDLMNECTKRLMEVYKVKTVSFFGDELKLEIENEVFFKAFGNEYRTESLWSPNMQKCVHSDDSLGISFHTNTKCRHKIDSMDFLIRNLIGCDEVYTENRKAIKVQDLIDMPFINVNRLISAGLYFDKGE